MTEINFTKNTITTNINKVLNRFWDITPEMANKTQIYRALCVVIRNELIEKRNDFKSEIDRLEKKQVYYICMEFLVGKSLRNNLFNLGIENQVAESLKNFNITLEELYEIEKDAGLGNGGLGRLAACFMDSLATQNYPATGFCIKYEFGLFKQKIIDGWQTELPDYWLSTSDVWLIPQIEERVVVKFDGEVKEEWTQEGLKVNYYNATEIEAIPYDMMISGYKSKGVSLLRLWESHSIKNIDMNLFSQGDYLKALSEDSMAEAISKVLYPSDNHSEGKLLRLKQQYFLVSASAQNIILNHVKKYKTLDNFSKKVAIHINDTHPALIIPELMRIFMDEYNCTWNESWDIVINSVSYTNHTILQEALETVDEEIVKMKIPRIYSIIQEINQQFCINIWNMNPGNWDKVNKMSIISHGKIKMASMSIAGSHTVNGVANLHSQILKKTIFKDFYEHSPNKFTNVTNGITNRRWLNQANPELGTLIDNLIGTDYYLQPHKLSLLKQYKNDNTVLLKLQDIKHENKLKFANYIHKTNNIIVNVDSIFDIQVKRLHEYKRQLLNILRIISIINDINNGIIENLVPETFIFGAKAAPSYYRAKEIIHLICTLSDYVNKEENKKLREFINIVFIENYSVSLAEIIIPAGEISEQISLAGKEASGTGNMKFMLNGALTIGTLDGANIEMIQALNNDNFFLFGMKDYEVEQLWEKGYNSISYYQKNEKLREIMHFLNSTILGKSFESISKYLLGLNGIGDPYMCLADFDSYMDVHSNASQLYYKDKTKWNQMSLINIASAGVFSADRTIDEYAKNIWDLKN